MLVFTRNGDVVALRTADEAAADLESIDVLDGEYEAILMLDGRIVQAAGQASEPVTLTITDTRDPAGLRERLQRAQHRLRLISDPDDPTNSFGSSESTAGLDRCAG